MVETIAMVVRGNMALVQPNLAVFYARKCIAQIGFAVAHGLNFSALQFNACFDNLDDFVFMARAAIVGHYF